MSEMWGKADIARMRAGNRALCRDRHDPATVTPLCRLRKRRGAGMANDSAVCRTSREQASPTKCGKKGDGRRAAERAGTGFTDTFATPS
jgi:hypothetical protein